jgi:hypothetical protein
MNQKILGTEVMINKMLPQFEQKDDDLDQWNMQDDNQDPESRKNISYVKMLNEINQREARIPDKVTGKPIPIPICGSSVGWHSSKRAWRQGDLGLLGPGINLYFKMLKYFSCWFFLFFLISLPSIAIFWKGGAFKNEETFLAKFIGSTTLGNLNSYENHKCSFASLEKVTP